MALSTFFQVTATMADITSSNIKFFVATLQRNGYTGTEVHRLLQNAWNENTISLRRVQQLMQESRAAENDDEAMNFSRQPGSGRPKSKRSDDNVNFIIFKNMLQSLPSLLVVCLNVLIS